MAIGPQIPQHLLNQLQRSSDDSDGSGDDDGPQPLASTSSSVGPQLPAVVVAAEVQKTPTEVAEDEDDEDDAYVPALPPDLVRPSAKPSTSSRQRAGPSAPSRRAAGPSFPSALSSSTSAAPAPTSHADSDSDSDDGYGPMPLPEGAQRSDGLSDGVREFMEREERRRKEVEEAAKPKKAVRDEWMLVPPSSGDIMGHLADPTKLKARQFSRSAAPSARGAPNNLWTETPAERAQRVADEVAGRKRRAADVEGAAAGPDPDNPETLRKRRRDEDLRKVVDEHNKSSRAHSLLALHKDTAKSDAASASKDKDGPPGVWDHARDMGLGGRLMDDKQRGKLIADARALGDRFGSGKGGGYL